VCLARPLVFALLLSAVTVPFGSAVAGAAVSGAPRVACFDVTGRKLDGFFSRPRTCGLVPVRSGYGNRLMDGRWSSWGSGSARGRGASYRLWSDIRVHLFAPKRVCGTRLFTKASVHYVGGGQKYWPDKTYTLKTC
jgi:hypothetical protein